MIATAERLLIVAIVAGSYTLGGATFANQRVTTQAPNASSCVVPPSVTSFLTTEGPVYLYFEATVTASDSLTNDWLAPDGTVIAGVGWNPASGDFCFDNAPGLAISNLPASQLGSWQTRVYDNGGLVFSVPFSVSAPPASGPNISAGGVVNGASFAPGPVAPGSIVSIFGTALASGTVQATTASLPTTLQSTRVLINGILAPLFYVSPSQVNVQVPWEVAGLFTTDLTVQVISNGSPSNVVATALAVTGPGIFVITHDADNTVVTSAKPAVPGEYLRVYSTGLGTVTNQPSTGAPAPLSPLSYTAQNSTVTIAGLSAYVPFSGLSPDFVGLNQVNVQVPAIATSASAAPLVLSNEGNSTTVSLAVQSGVVRQFTLTTTTAGNGSGSISANPTGPSYPAGTIVTLTATPNAGSIFTGWSGACSGTGGCTVTMNSNEAVTATFNLTANPTLTITKSGTGSGIVSSSPTGSSCGSGCLSFAAGTVVALTATPNTGSTFAGWSGVCSGASGCTVTMNSNQAVTAAFNLTSVPSTGVTDANGLTTLTSGGVTVPVQLTDPVSGSPIRGVTVALGLPSSQTGVAVLLIDDTTGKYPLQFVTLLASTSQTSFSPAAFPEQGSSTPTAVQAQLGCPSSLPANITVRPPIDSIYVPPPSPPSIEDAMFQAELDALNKIAPVLGVALSSVDHQATFATATDCANQVWGFLKSEVLPTTQSLPVDVSMWAFTKTSGLNLLPVEVFLTIAKTDVNELSLTLGACQNWVSGATMRAIQLGNQSILSLLFSGLPTTTSFVAQDVTVQNAQGQPLPSSVCYVSPGTLGGEYAGTTDSTGSGVVYLQPDQYTVDISSFGYAPASESLLVPAPGQPVPPLLVTLEPPTGSGVQIGTNVTYVRGSVSCSASGGFFDNCSGSVSLDIEVGIEHGEVAVTMDDVTFDGGMPYPVLGTQPGPVIISIEGPILQGTCSAGTISTDIQVIDGFGNGTSVQIGSSSSVPLTISCGAGT